MQSVNNAVHVLLDARGVHPLHVSSVWIISIYLRINAIRIVRILGPGIPACLSMECIDVTSVLMGVLTAMKNTSARSVLLTIIWWRRCARERVRPPIPVTFWWLRTRWYHCQGWLHLRCGWRLLWGWSCLSIRAFMCPMLCCLVVRSSSLFCWLPAWDP